MKYLSVKLLFLLCLMSVMLSSCSLLRPHKITIQQGNLINADNVQHLHKGMSVEEVKAIMGTPMLANIFTKGRIDYVYTLQNPYQRRIETQVTCLFVNHRLVSVRYLQ